MWISKKKWEEQRKRIADLEKEDRSQQSNRFVAEDSNGKHCEKLGGVIRQKY